MAPIVWFSKNKQSTIETRVVFGAEFVAMKQGMECLRGLRYKLRMMGVAVLAPSYIYEDNMSVIHNTQRPESMLKKKQILFAITPFVKPLPWENNVSLATCLHTITLPTYVPRIYQEGAIEIIWLVYSSTIWPITLDTPPHRGSRVSWVPLVFRFGQLPKCQCMPYALFNDRQATT